MILLSQRSGSTVSAFCRSRISLMTYLFKVQMTRFTMQKAFRELMAFAVVLSIASPVLAQTQLPKDVGTTVTGFQDDFDGTTLNTGWTVAGANVYSVSNGALHVFPATGDPNHLLYELPGYDNTVQEVLARVRVLNFGSGDLVRGGVGVGVDPASTQGINFLFRENTSDLQSALHMALLNDTIVWGPVQNFVWQPNTWYWVRLRQEPNAASQGGLNDIFAKIWLADGTQAEPANWQLTWDYTPSNPTRTGFAGITASSGSPFQFDVDYFLLKAAGLPSIVVAPNSFIQIPAAITSQPTNQTVLELSPATFTVGIAGNPAPIYQWYRGATPINSATNASYALASAAYTDNAAQFQVTVKNVVSNVTYSATSAVATLTVIADTNPPILLVAQPLALTQVQASFSKPISLATATNVANYQISGTNAPVAITSATLDASQTNITLTITPMSDGGVYTLTVNNLTDQSHASNIIASNSHVQFLASTYALTSIGAPFPAGSQVPAGDGYNISAGGAAVGGTNDQCQFSFQTRIGDFDWMVRLDSLGWSEAGLMVREDLSPGSVSASVLATPSISGAFFQYRSLTNGSTAISGSFPVNYPNTWLRLKRAGNVLSGFGSLDGQNWTQLGSLSAVLPSSLYFGFVVSSHNTNQLTTAAFRDFASVTTAGINGPLSIEPLGQCSRRTSLVLSEIMYHPTNSNLEFIELFDSRGEPQDLSGYQLGGSITYTFPPGSQIEGGGFVVVAKSPIDLENAYGLSGALGPYTNNLPNSKGTVRLSNQAGAVLLEVNYDTVPPWPISADGAGHSLVLAHPSYGEDNVQAWAASDSVGGSPGGLDPVTAEPLRAVVINEFLARSGPAAPWFVELFNRSTLPLDVSGCSLSDDPKTNKFVLPPGTVIPARSFLTYDQNALNFSPGAAGGTLYLRDAAGTRVLDAVRYEAQQSGVSFGRVPDGAATVRALTQPTPGTNNSPAWTGDIVINEIMYAPISLNDDDQYVELYNRGANAVDLSGWRFTSGIGFTFPSNTVIAPDGYFVVARNAARMVTNYPNLNAGNLAGNFTGTLSHRGERLALAMPESALILNAQGAWTTNLVYPVANEVSYQAGGEWGQWSHAGGSSLELLDPRADNDLAPNWTDSDETHKAAWTTISAIGTIDNGDVAADELQLLIQGVGEVLVDNVQVIDNNGNNRIANGTFEAGAAGWFAEGTEKTSGLESSEGFNSAKSYHLRSVNKGDNQVNRVRTLLTSALAAGTTNVTIRAAVRWLKGDPEVLLRLRGNWLECAAELPTPANPGTPGMRNSRWVANAPPAIMAVQHTPVLPAANQPVVVTAQVSDRDGLGPVLLKYRLDPNATYSTVPMTDNGTGGDVTAGDGIWTATIPGQPAGTMIAFYVQATDGALAPATATFPNDAPVRECLVRVGELQPTGNFPVYRIWMTQATFNTWNTNPRLDNSDYPVTFVLGGQRVIYNSGARFKGSPYISPGYCGPACGRCGYSISFPDDNLFLGETELVLDWPGGHGGETTALQEQMCYWIADRLNLPWSHRHTIRLHINGITDESRQATWEAVVQPVGSFVKEWVPNDSGGELFKIERAFEFNDSDGLIADPEPRLQNFITTGGLKKREHYRWNFMFRSTDRRDDYTNIFALVDAVNASGPEPYASGTLGLVDVEEWMGIFATEHIIENFDAYGHEIGKNMYAYLPPSGKWQLYMFDLDWAMLAAPIYSSQYTASAGPLFNSEDPTITRMYAFPPFARAYWRAIENAVNGPFDPANCNPVIDAKSRSLFANGILWCDGQRLTEPSAVKTWFSQRRAALQAQLATADAPFNITSILVSNDLATISGTAPIAVQTFWFNGAAWPVTWTSVSNWTATVVLQPGTNQWTLSGVDPHGQPVAGAQTNIAAVYGGTAGSPVGQIVINEIMYNPTFADAQYVELYNNSSTLSFDLSGWQFKGLSYTFPAGSMIRPNSFLVLAANRAAFAAAYGATNLVFDTFSGVFQPDGETLTLIQPASASAPEQVVAKVRYGSAPPWPAAANGAGSSLQLIDPNQDNWRVGNWSTGSSNSPSGPQWQYVTLTGSATQPTLLICMHGTAGDVYVDDLKLVAGSVPEAGSNLLQNGDFESQLSGPWTLSTNVLGSVISTALKHSGNASLHVIATSPGDTLSQAIWETTAPVVTNGTYTLSYWYLPSTSGSQLLIRLAGSSPGNGQVYSLQNIQPPVVTSLYTPAAPNSILASLPQFPPLWLNELQADNLTGVTNSAGRHVPWLELFNPTTSIVPLSGLYLGTNYANLSAWGFPAGSFINPGEFKIIFADAQTSLSTANELHTSFTLPSGSGSLAISRLYNGQWQVLDYVDYTNVGPNHSYGSMPDGQSFDRQEFALATPGATNNSTMPASYIPYITPGSVYGQNFDALPDPGTASVNSANPVTINGVIYSLANPFGFADPVLASGNSGGLGINGLAGWYGLGSLVSKFGASDGDQTTGGQISFGLPGSPNRALGLLATSSTGGTAFGAKFINQSGQTLNSISIQLLGELWRQSDLPKTLECSYFIDPTASAPFSGGQTALLPALNVSFPVSATAVGGVAVDGTASIDQSNLTLSNQPIANWTPGAALWLTWQMVDPTGKAQGLAIDNLSFSASTQGTPAQLPLNFQTTATNLILSWTGTAGQTYQIEYKDDLAASAWTTLGNPLTGTGATLTFTGDFTQSSHRFYRLKLVP